MFLVFHLIGFIDRDENSLPQQKKFANFNEFSEIKKIVKIRTKIRSMLEWKLTVTQQDEQVSI